MSQNVLDLHRRFTQALIELVVAPLVVECWEIDAASKAMKKAAVLHLQMKPSRLHKFDIAQHLGKSDRWVYRFLGSSNDHEQSDADVQLGSGYRLMRTTLSYVCARHPNFIAVPELADHLKQQHIKVDDRGLMGLIAIYESLGHLVVNRQEGDDFEHILICAADRLLISNVNSIAQKRLDRVLDILPRISKGLLAYVDGTKNVDVASIVASVTQGALDNLRSGFRNSMRNQVKQAIEESMEGAMNGDDEFKFNATFILFGDD